MRWPDVDLDSATWRIPMTKNEDPQVVALVDEAVALLRKRRREGDESGFVFPADSAGGTHAAEGPVAPAAPPGRAFRLENSRFAPLARKLQAITGASLSIIGKSLGHRSPSATAVYARLHLDPVRASLNTATSAMLVAAGVKKAGKVEPIRNRSSNRRRSG